MDQRGACPVSQFDAERWISYWLVLPPDYHPHLELMIGGRREGGDGGRRRGKGLLM